MNIWMKKFKLVAGCLLILTLCLCLNHAAFAADLIQTQDIPAVSVRVNPAENQTEVVSTLQLLFMISLISLAPFLLLMLTSFTRIIISLHFLRSALGTQQMPPNQVLVGIALFLTLFLMGPILTQINETAIKPYAQGTISQETTVEVAMEPLRAFMFAQVEDQDMRLFIRLSGRSYATKEEIPNRVLIPAFMLGELTKGFKIGFLIYMPFLVIDMIVASVLMAMGMMMLPPAMISLPFKLLLFVLVDGWSLVIENVLLTFKAIPF